MCDQRKTSYIAKWHLFCHLNYQLSQDILQGTVTRLWDGLSKFRMPARAGENSVLRNVQTISGAHRSPIKQVTGFVPGDKAAGT